MNQKKMIIEGVKDPRYMHSVYVSYDYPILFRCDSTEGGHFLFWEIMEDEAAEAWLVVQMTPVEMQLLEDGWSEVRTVYENNEPTIIAHWFDGDGYSYLTREQYKERYQEFAPIPPVGWRINPESIRRLVNEQK